MYLIAFQDVQPPVLPLSLGKAVQEARALLPPSRDQLQYLRLSLRPLQNSGPFSFLNQIYVINNSFLDQTRAAELQGPAEYRRRLASPSRVPPPSFPSLAALILP